LQYYDDKNSGWTLKKALTILNRKCEQACKETENLFKIVKFHRLSQKNVKGQKELVKRIGQFIYRTTMYLNKLKNSGEVSIR